MKLVFLTSLLNPMTLLIVMTIYVTIARMFGKPKKKLAHRSHIFKVGVASPEAFGAAMMFLSIAYRPNHAFVAKAQIQQHEDADDDDQGGPDTPEKHLRRQLRQIRRGEMVDRLIWRLE